MFWSVPADVSVDMRSERINVLIRAHPTTSGRVRRFLWSRQREPAASVEEM